MPTRNILLPLCSYLAIIAAAGAAEPRLKWEFIAESTLYAPPLVADLHPSPGLETVLCDSERRLLRCVDSTGKLLWEYDGGWKKRLTSAASLSRTARAGHGTLLVGNADGTLNCVDAATGKEIWRKDVGSIEWGTAIWADTDGDGTDEAIAGTWNAGIAVFSAAGAPRWTYTGDDTVPSIRIRCPIGAADIDADGKQEIFAVTNLGPICVDGTGALRWAAATGEDFFSTVLITDADADGQPELYCAANDDNSVFCFDARTGELRWKFHLLGASETYPGSSLAAGDLDQDGTEEIVVSDRLGNVYCLGADGRKHWVFQTEKRTDAAPSLGDVDGDGDIEVLVACGDHYLYCLSSTGVQKWRYRADRRLLYPATITDVDADGKTDILFCGSDRKLRCLTLDGRYAPELIPWPSRRFDAAQTGSAFGQRSRRPPVITEEPIFSNGGFEFGKVTRAKEEYPKGSNLYETRQSQPRGWFIEGQGSGAWGLDRETKRSGQSAVKISPAREPVVMVSADIEITREVKSLSASVWSKGGAACSARLRWKGAHGTMREDILKVAEEVEGWKRLCAPDLVPPRGAKWAALVCATSGTEGAAAWWDDAEIRGTLARAYQLRALVNQVGYDANMPKLFTVQANYPADTGTFEILAEDGSVAFGGPLAARGRITGAYGNDWGYNYWRGDFTAFNAPGTYRIKVAVGGVSDVSWPFEIGANVLWDHTARLAYRFFYYQRCGYEVPGFHKACHLDDATTPDHTKQLDLAGGWHDAGDYNKYHNAPYALGLAKAYGLQKALFDQQDEDRNGRSDFLDEILWGGDHVRRMILPDGSVPGGITSGYGFWGPPELETDNLPLTGDERPITEPLSGADPGSHLNAMAKIARFAPDPAPFVEAAKRSLRWCRENNQNAPAQFAAAVDLYMVTKDEKYAALAKELFPSVGLNDLDAAEDYDTVFKEDHRGAGKDAGAPSHETLRARLTARAEEALALADNPFGVYTYGPKEKPNFFGTPAKDRGWHVGTCSRLLEGAAIAAQAYRYNPDPRYLVFIHDQFNWILGNNPYDLCLMEGVGSVNPPSYHQRLTFAGVPRGAVPGSVVNGITWRDVGDDRPYFDMRGLDIPDFEPNEVWLPHNVNYLNALTSLQRIHPKGL